MEILYKVHNNLYVNLTNKCPYACTFCLRQTMDRIGESDRLWLEREPSVEEVKKEYAKKGLLYKYQAFEMRYIEQKTLEDIAEKLNCGKNSPANWIKEINRKMAVKLYGVKAL